MGMTAAEKAALKQQREDQILDTAKNLKPTDTSDRAQGIRETAGSIQDHREAAAIRAEQAKQQS